MELSINDMTINHIDEYEVCFSLSDNGSERLTQKYGIPGVLIILGFRYLLNEKIIILEKANPNSTWLDFQYTDDEELMNIIKLRLDDLGKKRFKGEMETNTDLNDLLKGLKEGFIDVNSLQASEYMYLKPREEFSQKHESQANQSSRN